MTDLVAENLWVDSTVAKAPNLALVYSRLPPLPAIGDMAIYNGDVFRTIGGWDSGILCDFAPSPRLRAIGIDIQGNIYVSGGQSVQNERIYKYSDGIWDSGVSQTERINGVVTGPGSSAGLSIKANGDIVVSRLGSTHTFVFVYSGGHWAQVAPFPVGVAGVEGLVTYGNDVISMYSSDPTSKIYTYDGASWDAGIDPPPVATDIKGLARNSAGRFLVVDVDTRKIYTQTLTGWDTVNTLDIPALASNPTGLAIDVNGSIVMLDASTGRFYTLSMNDAELPAERGLVRWTGTQWENL